MPRNIAVDWSVLIEDVLLEPLVTFAHRAAPAVRTAYHTGSYARGQWNPNRPNVNLYFIAAPEETVWVRAELACVFAEIRRAARAQGVDFLVDCHPFTISQRDAEWLDAPLLTLTTKVFSAAHADARQRLLVSPTIGYGWWATHRILHGEPDALEMLAVPPPRNEAWFRGAHASLSHYGRLLDHLPWALDVNLHTRRFVEETSRYAEETIKDGVHFGATDAEVESAAEVEVLHRWGELARDFFLERYGPDGVWAVDTVAALKEAVLRPDHVPQHALSQWQDAVGVWKIVWDRFIRLAREHDVPLDLMQVMSWM